MIGSFLAWYLVVQLISLLTLPLCSRLFVALPDRGYALSKSLGILLVGFTLWLGTSYGLLRNEAGGAWLALILVGVVSLSLGWTQMMRLRREPWLRSNRNHIIATEILFLCAFAAWTIVRMYDPAANHTEQPMDLMFMNSIWASPTFPPHDAWLAGYAISYYYFGYWLLTTLGHLSSQPPQLAYTLGQACWFGLLLIGCYGLTHDLLALRRRLGPEPDAVVGVGLQRLRAGGSPELFGGLLAALAVGVTGNLEVILEWLNAMGAHMTAVAAWFGVNNFAANASSTGQWYISFDWWWWRGSRVLEDLDLLGHHIEVIDEFPMFSYILGDNHPHVLAMPFVILVIAFAANLFFAGFLYPVTPSKGSPVFRADKATVAEWLAVVPMGGAGLALLVVASGALVFLNTWDFPPYWLLLVLCMGAVGCLLVVRGTWSWQMAVTGVVALGGAVVAGLVVIYLPYFLSAQSQAGGFVPNFWNPTKLRQFVLMFGAFMPSVAAFLIMAWQENPPPHKTWLLSLAAVYGLPIVFLIGSVAFALGSGHGQAMLQSMALPEGATSYLPFILARWRSQPWTFLVVGAALAMACALIWQRLSSYTRHSGNADQVSTTFVLFLTAIGLLLVYAPEVVFLRDNFGTRMNTVFKFYYQAWLLFGLCTGYTVAIALRRPVSGRDRLVFALSAVAVLLTAAGLIYPVAGVYSKTRGFSSKTPTLDATAYVSNENPDEFAAVDWVRRHTAPNAIVVEGKGQSYWSSYNRISAMTGRPTLLGWDGHEAQWRGAAYSSMADGRVQALETIYRTGTPDQITQALSRWHIDYVYVGPTEREEYKMTPRDDERLQQAMDLVFQSGTVRIYRAVDTAR